MHPITRRGVYAAHRSPCGFSLLMTTFHDWSIASSLINFGPTSMSRIAYTSLRERLDDPNATCTLYLFFLWCAIDLNTSGSFFSAFCNASLGHRQTQRIISILTWNVFGVTVVSSINSCDLVDGLLFFLYSRKLHGWTNRSSCSSVSSWEIGGLFKPWVLHPHASPV